MTHEIRHCGFRLDGVEMGQPLTAAEAEYVASARRAPKPNGGDMSDTHRDDCVCLSCEDEMRVETLRRIADHAAWLQRTENYDSHPAFTLGELDVIESALRDAINASVPSA